MPAKNTASDTPEQANDRILTRREGLRRMGVSATGAAGRAAADPSFPALVQRTPARQGYRESEVIRWVSSRPTGPVPKRAAALVKARAVLAAKRAAAKAANATH